MLEVKKLSSGTLLDIEYLQSTNGVETPEPHRHEYFEIFWVLDGEGSHSIDFFEHPLNTRLIYFIAPGQVHHAHVLPKEMLAISFNPNLISSDLRSQQILEQIFLKNRSGHPSISIDAVGQTTLLKLIDVLSDELSNSICDNELINILFTGVLRYLVRYQPNEVDTPKVNDERMLNLLQIIDRHFKPQKHTGFYAEQLSLSGKRLNELSQRYFGKRKIPEHCRRGYFLLRSPSRNLR